MPTRKVLHNIDFTSVMHPDDRKTIEWLNGLQVPYRTNWQFFKEIAMHPLEHNIKEWYEIFKAGAEFYTFQDFLRATTSKYREAYNEVENQGEGVNITAESLPKMHKQLIEACRTLSINHIPAYSTDWMYAPYHYSNGEIHRRIVMMSGSADMFDENEMHFVLGHELGHQVAGHKPYHMLLETIYMASSSTVIIGLDREIADLREKENVLNAKWQNERRQLERIQDMTSEVQRLEINIEAAEQQNRYSEVVGLKRRAESLRSQIEGLTGELNSNGETLLKSALDDKDIMKVVTAWTGIPMTNMTQDENEKLLHIEDILHNTIIGQQNAVKAVSDAIRRNRMGLSDADKPIGTFLFLGTTGVGKTELCKALAEYLFNSRDMLVRIDMSEYQQEHSVARLFGAPPGYVGYDEGGQLTEAVRRKPYSVVLFDEIEKAHPKVFETLLQLLDDGRMTDGQGRVVDFKNTIVIMTSNMGQDVIMNSLVGSQMNADLIEMVKNQVLLQLKQRVAPEFINRIDDVVMFLPLSQEDIKKIVSIQLESLKKKLKKNDINITFDDSAVAFLARKGYKPEYGGRPVKRAIKEYVVDALSLALLRQEVVKTSPIRVSAQNENLVIRNQ